MVTNREFFRFVSLPMVRALGLHRASALSCELAEEISPTMTIRGNGFVIRMDCLTELARYRASNFFSKEPETIAWIDTMMQPDETLLDIGANVGVYSLYAAAKDLRVYAIEPETQNVALLNRNIYLNQWGDRITAFNIALSDHDGVDELYLARMYSGAALHNLGKRSTTRAALSPRLFGMA